MNSIKGRTNMEILRHLLPVLVMVASVHSALGQAYQLETVPGEGFTTAIVVVGHNKVPASMASKADYPSRVLQELGRKFSGGLPPANSHGWIKVELPPGVTSAQIRITDPESTVPLVELETSESPFTIPLLAGDSKVGRPPVYEITGDNGSTLLHWSGWGSLTNVGMRQYRGELLAEPDSLFDSYWKRARQEVDQVELAAAVTRVPERDTPGGLFHRVEISSTEGTRIAGWYIHPKSSPGKVPAILILPGYGAEEPPSDRTADGFATLALSPRGHGPSVDLGWLPQGEFLMHNILEPEKYFYLRAVQDAVQGVRFLDGHTSVSVIGVEGGSQGGMLALGAAALCPDEVKAVCSNVPCFSDYGSSMKSALGGPHASFRKARETASRSDEIMMNASQGLTDGAALAARVKQPLQVVMGSLDGMSPVMSGFAIINQSPSKKKSLVLLASYGHALPVPMQQRNRAWFLQHLGSGAVPAR